MSLSVWQNTTAPKTIKYIDRELMARVCHPLAVDFFDHATDPIGTYTEENISLLESALHQPRQTFDGKDLYPTLASKAAVLFYGLNRNHPFQNGNKRVSAASLFVFLYINDYALIVDDDAFVEKTLKVAQAPADQRDSILQDLEAWITAHITYREN